MSVAARRTDVRRGAGPGPIPPAETGSSTVKNRTGAQGSIAPRRSWRCGTASASGSRALESGCDAARRPAEESAFELVEATERSETGGDVSRSGHSIDYELAASASGNAAASSTSRQNPAGRQSAARHKALPRAIRAHAMRMRQVELHPARGTSAAAARAEWRGRARRARRGAPARHGEVTAEQSQGRASPSVCGGRCEKTGKGEARCSATAASPNRLQADLAVVFLYWSFSRLAFRRWLVGSNGRSQPSTAREVETVSAGSNLDLPALAGGLAQPQDELVSVLGELERLHRDSVAVEREKGEALRSRAEGRPVPLACPPAAGRRAEAG